MRKVLIWSTRVLGALLLAAFLLAGTYWLAASGLPDHRLDGASSWHGCIPPDAKAVEFVPLSAMPANAVNAFLADLEPDFLTVDYVRQLLFCSKNLAGSSAYWDIKAALLYHRIERDLPRRNILETVINTTYLGNGAYGMPAAAIRYFRKPLKELSIGELAFLASLIGNPYSAPAPYSDLPLDRRKAAVTEHMALKSRDVILDRMAHKGTLNAEQAAAAKLEALNLRL